MDHNHAARIVKGIFPLTGRLTDEGWAEVFDVKMGTIRDWVKEYHIPHKRFGNSIVIDAKDFWDAGCLS